MALSRRAGVLLILSLSGVLAVLLVPLPVAWHGGWRGQLFDLGHIPLFAVLTILLWGILAGPWYRAAIIALGIAAVAEGVQGVTGRSASLGDFLRGAAGVFAATLILGVFATPRRIGIIVARLLAALFVVGLAAAGPAPRLLDAAEGYAAFPVLADFRTARQMRRWHTQQAELTRLPNPHRPDESIARLEFLPGPDEYSSAQLEHVVRDAREYRWLCWSFTVHDGPVTLAFSLRGGPNPEGVTSHHQIAGTFGPGEHEATIDLAQAALRARPNRLEESNLWWSQVFVIRPARRCTIDLHRVWLE